MTIGYEYQKTPRFNTIYCEGCANDEWFDWDYMMEITADEEGLACDICGKELGGDE